MSGTSMTACKSIHSMAGKCSSLVLMGPYSVSCDDPDKPSKIQMCSSVPTCARRSPQCQVAPTCGVKPDVPENRISRMFAEHSSSSRPQMAAAPGPMPVAASTTSTLPILPCCLPQNSTRFGYRSAVVLFLLFLIQLIKWIEDISK